MSKIYQDIDVLTAAKSRVDLVFDEFERIVVSFSGGKDSTVLLDMVQREAVKRNRMIDVLFIDLEGQYQSTIECIESYLERPNLRWWWICLPLNLRNGVSMFEPHWTCWEPGAEKLWVRDMPPYDCVVSDVDYFPFFRVGMEFEEFIVEFPKWLYETEDTGKFASLVAIRSDESLNRFLAVGKKLSPKKSAYHDNDGSIVMWGTVLAEKHPDIVSLYPIYDWRFEDIWRYIHDQKCPYSAVYDRMYLAGTNTVDMRICQPYGDDQRKGLDLWAKIEPETWGKVLDRVTGVNYGSKYAGQKMMGYKRGLKLPEGHTWKSYTFFLLSTLPDVMRERYLSNYAVFLEWWMRHGYPDLGEVHDDETKALKDSDRRKLPSWRRLCLAILKYDFNCKSLSIGAIKDVKSDVYDRVEAGDPVKVRKSVKPVYDYLREQYQSYLDEGIEAVELEFSLPSAEESPVKQKYADI